MTLCETPSHDDECNGNNRGATALRTRGRAALLPDAAVSRRTLRRDTTTVFRSWLQSPLRTAAVAPSGPALARLITRDITATDRVVELGPGTGVFTRALFARGVPPSRLTVVEANPEFVELLSTRFENLNIVCADAATDSWQLGDHTEIDAVVSGLPLLSMSVDAVSGVLSTAFSALRPQGRFYQFTYGPTCPVRPKVMAALHLRATRVGWTPRNLPPASVYRIERRPV